MKIKISKLLKPGLFILTILILAGGCKKKEDDEETTTRSGSFIAGGTAMAVAKPYLGIFNDNGTIENTLTMTAATGAELEFNFEGSTPQVYPLQSFSDANYTDITGKQYNSFTGQLVVSSYTIDGAVYKASGTFSFSAKNIASPFDTIQITGGLFTNASNEF